MAILADLVANLRLNAADFIDQSKAALDQWNITSQSMIANGAELSVAVSAPLAAAGAALVASASSVDSALDTIRVGTGKTGQDLDALGQSLGNVLSDVPASFEDASKVIADLNTRLGLTGAPLEALSAQFLNLAHITGQDVTESVSAATRLFGDWSVATQNQAQTMDYLFKVSQATGVGFSQLAAGLVQFGAPLRQMGFDLQTSAALLGKFEKEGVNTELVMGSLRIALGKMAQEGVTDAKAALIQLTESIKNAGSTGEANRKAIELFGARAGPDMAAAIREGRFEMSGLIDDLKKSPETINEAATSTADFAEKFEVLKNKAILAVEPLAVKLFDALGKLADRATPLIGLIGNVANWIAKLPEPVLETAAAITGLAAALGPMLLIFGQIAGSGIIGNIAAGLGAEGLGGIFSAMIPLLGPIAIGVGAIAAAFALWKLEPVRNAVQSAWDVISGFWTSTLKPFLTEVAGIGAAFIKAAQGIVSSGLASALSGVNTAANTLVSIFNSVFGALSTFIGWINKVPGASFVLSITAISGALQILTGTSLPGAISGLMTFAVEGIGNAVAALIGFAMTTLPAAIASLAEFAVTAIPNAVAALVGFAMTTLPAAIISMTSFASTAIPAAITALGSLGSAAILAAGAFAGFKLGEWAANNIPWVNKLSQSIVDFLNKIPGVTAAINALTGATAAQNRANQDGDFVLTKAEQTLAKYGITIDKTGKSQKQYADAVFAAVKQQIAQNDATGTVVKTMSDAEKAAKKKADADKKAADAAAAHAKAIADQKAKQEALNTTLQNAQQDLKKAQDLYKEGKISIDALGIATDAVKKAQSALDDEFLRAHPALAKLTDTTLQLSPAMTSAERGLFSFQQQLVQAALATQTEQQALDSMIESMDAADGVVGNLSVGIAAMSTPAYTAADAMKELGITSSDALKKAADTAQTAYETIANDGNSTAGEVQQAWQKMTEAQIAYARSIGDSATADALQKQVDAHKSAGSNIQNTWQNAMKQVSTAFTDFSKGIVDDLFNGDFSINKSLEDLGKAFSRIFVEDAMSYVNQFVDKSIKYLLNSLDDLLGKLPGIGDALKNVFGGGGLLGTGIGAGTSAAGSIGGAAGQAAGGSASSGAGVAGAAVSAGLMGTLGVVFAGISAVGSILQAFGVGQQGQKDRLNGIDNATTYLAQLFGDQGLGNSLKGLCNDFKSYSDGFAGWYRGVIDDISDHTGGIQQYTAQMLQALTWAGGIKDTISAIQTSNDLYLPELTRIRTAVESQKQGVTVNVTGYVGDRDALIAQIKLALSQDLASQGA